MTITLILDEMDVWTLSQLRNTLFAKPREKQKASDKAQFELVNRIYSQVVKQQKP